MRYEVRTRRWTRAEYDRLIDIGLLDEDEPIELLGGELVFREPESGPHYTATYLIAEVLRAAVGAEWHVRMKGPIALDDESEPEPDVCVVPGTIRDYRYEHPARPVLIVEVSATRSRLWFDGARKAGLYARARIADYWILNLVNKRLEIHRAPEADAAASFGWRYTSREIVEEDGHAVPLALPSARIAVRDLLP